MTKTSRISLALLITAFFIGHLIPTQTMSQTTSMPKKITKKPKKKTAKKKKRKKKRSSKPQMASDQAMVLEYGSSNWNRGSTDIDSAVIVVRDRNSGKAAKILLDETAPDSSVFSGKFKVGWGNKKIQPEVYIPSQPKKDDTQWLKRVLDNVKNKKLPRKPFVSVKDERGQNVLKIYDTSAQAREALELYKYELEQRKKRGYARRPNDPTPEAPILDAEDLAKKERQRKEAIRLQEERLRLAQIEEKKRRDRLRELSRLKKVELEKRKNEARRLAAAAVKQFKANNFEKAVSLFEKAVTLDPSDRSYYFLYGVSLYRINKFNLSIVILLQAVGKAVKIADRDFYIGLNYYRIKESQKAHLEFDKVKKADPKNIGSTAAFYSGIVHMQDKEYNEAKDEFQWVLDNSQDPKLDQKAEEMIEKVLALQKIEKLAKTKNFVNALFGLQYNSNILSSSESAQDIGTATNVGGGRILAVGGYRYRPYYKEKEELSIKYSTVYQYSFRASFTAADAFLNTLTVPYVRKGTLFGKGAKYSVEPGYELLNLDVNTDGKRERILDSILLNSDMSLVMGPNWVSVYKFQYRNDDSKLTITDAADDASANRYILKTTQSIFLNKKKDKASLNTFGIQWNDADGQNNNWFRFDLGTSYVMPFYWDSSMILGLSYFNLGYSDRTDNRTDNNYNLSFTLSKPINDEFTALFTGGYIRNDSNVADNEFTQWTVMSAISYNGAF